MTRFYTRAGDCGDTNLIGKRADKGSGRVCAYGTVDELNSLVGVAISFSSDDALRQLLRSIQSDLFVLGSDLAAPLPQTKVPRADGRMVAWLEGEIGSREKNLPELRNFVLPGGCREAALLHACRSVCRRAERECVTLLRAEGDGSVNPFALQYLNRLSSLLFVLALEANAKAGVGEKEWKGGE
ncbi:cob(I)yrinic acid a,c-diamide adenosyltransferase [Candidatus Micrarchaeota archaeon]|nr:cob(I)yrinic acid a,c-diamide adenosyltransferase [Candidatus Micrarchaeota archaeon]